MERAFLRYLRYHRAEGHSEATIKYHRDSIERSFLPFLRLAVQTIPQAGSCLPDLRALTVADLNADAALDWIDDQRARGLSQKTIATRIISLKAFSRWLVAEDWLTKDPLAKLKVPKVDDKPKATLAPADVETLLRSCDRTKLTGRRDVAMLLLLFSTGLRASEVVGLAVADIDWSTGLITIRRGKGGKTRVLPIGAMVEKALQRYLSHPQRADHPHVFLNNQGEPLPYRGLVAALHRLEVRTGLHCNAHKFRHSAAITYLRNGGRVETLRSLLGHTTLAMSLHYARVAGVDLAAAHETADPARSLKVRV